MIEALRTIVAFTVTGLLFWWVTGDKDASLVDRVNDVASFIWKQVSQ